MREHALLYKVRQRLSPEAFIPRRTGRPCDAAGASIYICTDPRCNAAKRPAAASDPWYQSGSRRETDDVALEHECATLVEGGHHLRYLRRVKVLVLVGRHRRVQVRDEGRDRELI